MDAGDAGEGKHARERTRKIHTSTHDIPRFGALVWR